MKRFLPGDLVTVPRHHYSKHSYESLSISLYDIVTGEQCGSLRAYEVAIVISAGPNDVHKASTMITLFTQGCLGVTSSQYVALA